MSVTITGYQKNYIHLTKEFYERDRTLFDRAVVICRCNELENGAYMTRMNKPNWKGTKITFKVCRDAEEWNREIQRLKEDSEKIIESLKMEEQEDE